MSDKQQLLDMGFDPARIDWALRATNKAGLQVRSSSLFDLSPCIPATPH